jgi:hypothetical protein
VLNLRTLPLPNILPILPKEFHLVKIGPFISATVMANSNQGYGTSGAERIGPWQERLQGSLVPIRSKGIKGLSDDS